MAEKKSLNEMLAGLPQSDARNSLVSLFDEGSFVETQQFVSADGAVSSVVTGYGLIDGAPVYAFAEDCDVKGGAFSGVSATKIKNIYGMAVKNGSPVVGIYNSKGGDVSEGALLMAAYGDIIATSAKLSGVVPQISIVTGVCGGIASTLCCMADIVIMSKEAELFLTPPFVAEDGKLPGAGSAENAAKSGVANIVCDNADDAIEKAKQLIRVLPQNNLSLSGNDYFEGNAAVVSADLKGLDMINAVADANSVCELNQAFGTTAVTALGSLNWRTIGFVSAQGRLSGNDSAKIARFVNFCDAFSIPVVTFVDTDGFEQSVAAELAGCVRDSAKLAQVYASATTAKISVVTGNAVGASAIALGTLTAGSDICLAFENAVIGPVLPKTAAVFLGVDENEYYVNEANAFAAMAKGLVDRVIDPSELKIALTGAIDVTSDKRESTPSRKHINLVF